MDREFVLPTDSEKLSHRAIFDAIRRRREEAMTQLEVEMETLVEAAVDVEEAARSIAEQTAVVAKLSLNQSSQEELPMEPMMEEEVELEAIAQVASESVDAALPNPMVPPKPLRFVDGKKYFRIAEVSALLEAEPDQLRRWEQHFSTVVKPEKHGGQRVYRRKDVRALHLIRHMILEEHYAVSDARRYYRARRRALDEQAGVERQRAIESLETTARDLRELVRLALQH